MSHTPTKKSVFDRIERSRGESFSSSGTTNDSHKSTHGFCNAFIKSGTCPLGETCKYIHEQPNRDKPSDLNEDLRLTKTITRVVDMSSIPIKSTVTVSNEQRPVVVMTSSGQSNRTVVESGTDHSDRRLSGSDRTQSQSRHSDSKQKPSSSFNDLSKKKSQPYESRHSSKKKKRPLHSDSAVSSASDSEHTHSIRKHKKKSDNPSTSSKSKRYEPISSPHDEQDTLNDQITRPTPSHKKSPKRTIVITDRNKSDNPKQHNKESMRSRVNSDIEFLGSKKSDREVKAIETIHQQAENNKKSTEIKREKKSPAKSSSEHQRRHSSSTNTSSTSTNEKNIQIKTEETKHQSSKTQTSSERYERSDRHVLQATPLVVQLSPRPPIATLSEVPERESVAQTIEIEKTTPVDPPSPVCVILDDDSSPAPSIEKKTTRLISVAPVKKTSENEKSTSKQSKRSRDSDKSHNRDKTNETKEIKRKRLNDGGSRKLTSSSKNENENRSTSSRSDAHRGATISSRDESSSRKYKDKSESKTNRSNESKDRSTATVSSKSRSSNSRRDTTRSTPEKTRSTHRRDKEKGLENVTDSEEHHDEPSLPKQTVLESYLSMDWSTLSRDKRIPLNTQVTSRITRLDQSNRSMGISERLLTDEQKEQLNGVECQALPLRHFMKQLQTKSASQIVPSCNRRLGSCAKDMIDMRHRWFTKSSEPVQQYAFINKDHYMAFQQAISSLLDATSTDTSSVQTETTLATTDTL